MGWIGAVTGASGILYLVSTPIGNLADLSERAAATFAAVDTVACEDTRRTGRLLKSLGLRKRLLSLHDHNESERIDPLLERLRAGESVAIASDAGTPLVSDPGFRLVRAAIEADIEVRSIPGPSAVLAALTSSGLAPQPFTFLGFPPPRKGKRRSFLARFGELEHTLVLFESPHRIVSSLEDCLLTFGPRSAVLSRELTKLHEEILRGSLDEILEEVRRRERLKGEIVLVIDGK